MKSGFELLKTRKPEDIFNVDLLEEKYSFILPPLYKVFMQTFDFNEYSSNQLLHSEEYINSDGSISYAATSMYKGEEGTESFTNFNALEVSLKLKDEFEEWSEKQYLPIGDAFHGHGAILVGTQPPQQDQIFLHDIELGGVSKIADNIFDFVKSIYLEYEFFSDDVDHSKLYKNWGESFWRLKSESNGSDTVLKIN